MTFEEKRRKFELKKQIELANRIFSLGFSVRGRDESEIMKKAMEYLKTELKAENIIDTLPYRVAAEIGLRNYISDAGRYLNNLEDKLKYERR